MIRSLALLLAVCAAFCGLNRRPGAGLAGAARLQIETDPLKGSEIEAAGQAL